MCIHTYTFTCVTCKCMDAICFSGPFNVFSKQEVVMKLGKEWLFTCWSNGIISTVQLVIL